MFVGILVFGDCPFISTSLFLGFEGDIRGSQITGDESFGFKSVNGVRQNECSESKSKEKSKQKKKITCRNLND